MKVLFIDDEALIRKGYQAIIRWKEYGFTKCLEAEDGKEGIEQIKMQNPELVLLDIRMQDMDGIELAKQVRGMGFKGRIIIISGYSDFEYAKSAIFCDVTAYLLKPVDTSELISAIQRVRDELERNSLLSIYAGQPLKRSISTIISDLLTGRLKYSSDISLAYSLDLTGTYHKLVSIHSTKSSDKSDAIKDFLNKFAKNSLLTTVIDGKVFILFRSKIHYHEYEQLRNNYMQETGPYDLYFVESETIRDIDTLPLCYSQIRIITEKLFYYADSSHTVKLPIPAPPVNTRDFNILDQTQKIINALLLLNNSLMSDLVNEFSSYLNHMETPIETISFILGNSYQQIISELSINYPQLEIEFPSYKSLLSKLCEFHFLYEYIDYMKKLLIKIIYFINKEKNLYPCKNLCSYIEENYSSSLKLESIAEQFGYNSSYLGKLFKREMGESFNTFVDKIRIKNAKDYLIKNASVSQTAIYVGYSDMDYFTKKFKKYVGLLPSEFKKINHIK